MLPTGAALLVLVMTLVLLAIIVWAIIIPGIRLLARQWQQGQRLRIIDNLALVVIGITVAMQWSTLLTHSASEFFRIGIPTLGAIGGALCVISLSAYWRVARKYRHRALMKRVVTLFIFLIIYAIIYALTIYQLFTVIPAG